MANNAKIKAAGVTPVIQTYQDTWTSQLLVLANHHNVAAEDGDWADKYTKNQTKFAQEPGLGWLQAPRGGPQGGLHEPERRLGQVRGGPARARGRKGRALSDAHGLGRRDRGLEPGQDRRHRLLRAPWRRRRGQTASRSGFRAASTSRRRRRAPSSRRPRSSSPSWRAPRGATCRPRPSRRPGPTCSRAATLPGDVPGAIKDLEPYVESGDVTPALEFVSPVKGPALEQITVEVGSGLRSASSGAALYDKDVEEAGSAAGARGLVAGRRMTARTSPAAGRRARTPTGSTCPPSWCSWCCSWCRRSPRSSTASPAGRCSTGSSSASTTSRPSSRSRPSPGA